MVPVAVAAAAAAAVAVLVNSAMDTHTSVFVSEHMCKQANRVGRWGWWRGCTCAVSCQLPNGSAPAQQPVPGLHVVYDTWYGRGQRAGHVGRRTFGLRKCDRPPRDTEATFPVFSKGVHECERCGERETMELYGHPEPI